MEIIYKKVSEIQPYKNNPRNNDAAIEKTKQSILLHGFINPILVDKDSIVIAGHTRLEAAKLLELEEVPCIVTELDDEDLIKQYRIIDNKTADLSSWDIPKLIEELSDIKEIDMTVFDFADLSIGEPDGEESEDAGGYEGNLGAGIEINLDDFGDEQFEYECPWCGFKWNE